MSGYFEDDEATAAAVTPDGWFRTGDIASIDPDGYVILRDRSKDVIKSGGEWISYASGSRRVISKSDGHLAAA